MEIKFVERGTGTYCVHQGAAHVATLSYLGARQWLLYNESVHEHIEAETAEDAQQRAAAYLQAQATTGAADEEASASALDKDFEAMVDMQLSALGGYVMMKDANYVTVYASALVRELARTLVACAKPGLLPQLREDTIRLLDLNLSECQTRVQRADEAQKRLSELQDILMQAAGKPPGDKMNLN
jgi:hypothetical protein